MSIVTRQLRGLYGPIIACLLPIVFVPAAQGQPQPPVVRYVNGDLTANGDGLDWTTAYKFLQDALAEASDHAGPDNHYQIWVAATDAGNPYRPDRSADNPQGTGNRDDTFTLHDYVAVYGGFVSGDDDLADRDPEVNETVLSGDIGTPGIDTDNSLHVVTAPDVEPTALLDGFTITGGYADGGIGNSSDGGGIIIFNAPPLFKSGPLIVRCKLTNNFAEDEGGGVHVFGPFADPVLINCVFAENVATEGGGIHWENQPEGVTLVNCVFVDNTAAAHGGAIDSGGGAEILNCTFVGNEALVEGGGEGGGAIWAEYDKTNVANGILWDNVPNQIQEHSGADVIVTYSDVEGGWPGTGNVDADPRFVDSEAGDFRLAKPCSPCVDAGHPGDGGTVNSSCPVPGDYSVPCALTCPLPPEEPGSGIPCDDPWDVDQDGSTGEPTPDLRSPSYPTSLDRVLDGEGDVIDDPRIDMGAYEFVRKCCPWDCQTNVPPDGEVGPDDANSLRLQYGQECTTCDFGVGLPWVDDSDWFALVAHWGPCDCDVAQQAHAGGPAAQLTIEEAVWLLGFDGVDDYIAWGYQASEPEVLVSMDLLLALFGY